MEFFSKLIFILASSVLVFGFFRLRYGEATRCMHCFICISRAFVWKSRFGQNPMVFAIIFWFYKFDINLTVLTPKRHILEWFHIFWATEREHLSMGLKISAFGVLLQKLCYINSLLLLSRSPALLMLTHCLPYLQMARPTNFRFGIWMEDDDPHQPQAPRPPRSNVKVARFRGQYELSWPNAVPVSIEAGGGIPCRPNWCPHFCLHGHP